MFQILYELVFRNSFRTGGRYLQIIQATKFCTVVLGIPNIEKSKWRSSQTQKHRR